MTPINTIPRINKQVADKLNEVISLINLIDKPHIPCKLTNHSRKIAEIPEEKQTAWCGRDMLLPSKPSYVIAKKRHNTQIRIIDKLFTGNTLYFAKKNSNI